LNSFTGEAWAKRPERRLPSDLLLSFAQPYPAQG
jgi:hypothetical protein